MTRIYPDLNPLPLSSLANPQNVHLVVQDENTAGPLNDFRLALNQLSDPAPTQLTPATSMTLDGSARMIVLVNSQTVSRTVTVSSGASHLIVNVSDNGSNLVLITTGNSNKTLTPGESAWVLWDGAAHDVTVSAGGGGGGGGGSITIDDAMDDVSTNPVQNAVLKQYIDDKTQVDAVMDDVSERAVQNKVVKAYIESLASSSGQIKLMRNGSLVQDYGLTASSPTQYGTALVSALSALQAGDTLVLRGVRAAGTGWTLAQSNVRLVCEESQLVAGGNYAQLMQVNGSDNRIEGLVVDGLASANTSDGCGIRLVGARNRLRNCEAHRTRGGGGFLNPSALQIQGNDNFVDGYRSISAGYSAVRIRDAVRSVVMNAYIEDPLDRAVNVEGTGQMELVRLVNFVGRYRFQGSGAGVFTNLNVSGMLERLEIDNYDMENSDVWGTGYSYNHPDGLQMFKCHGLRRGYFHRMRLWHGGNLQNVLAPTFRVPGQGGSEGYTPEELHFTDCVFAGHLKFSQDGSYSKLVKLRGCHVGARAMYGSQPIRDVTAEVMDIEDCTLNAHNQTTAVMFNEPRKDNSIFRMVRTRVFFNSSAQAFVFAGGPNINSLRKSIGHMIVHDNEYLQMGSGGLVISNTSAARLAMTTDPTGAMLFDGHLTPFGTSSTQMPNPGAGPSYFGADLVPPIKGGVQIWNTAYNENALDHNVIRGWVSALTPPRAVTFSTADTIAATAHGLLNGDLVFFTLGSRNTRFLATFATNDEITATGHTLANGNVVELEFGPDTVPPRAVVSGVGGLLKEKFPYYVRDVSGSTFKLAATSGGAAIDITTAHVGTIYVRRRELPAALSTGTRYFVVEKTDDNFKVSLTTGGTAVDLTDTGSGGTPRVVCSRWQAMP